ncbi:uncharacterized protein LOC119457361 [Dermacentor silvarum]|uniref:uncharacterized protein LOC119457361 n=1 Tax=Dermacentor silvarum TaxID=543639 RepID=UPI002101965D|nr:uncharacterized protein LOC119457361 [Dermacentor silvarum]
MVNCAVFGCNNESRRKTDSGENTKKLSFFSVPNVVRWQCSQTLEISTKRRAEWFRRLYRGDINTDATHYKVCSEHFVSGRPSYLMDLTNPDWAPSLHLGYDTKSTTRSEERHQRRCKRAATPKVVQKADSRVLRPLTTMLNAQQSAVNSTVTSKMADSYKGNISFNDIQRLNIFVFMQAHHLQVPLQYKMTKAMSHICLMQLIVA